MKKSILGISLGILSVFTLVSCNKDNNGGNTKIGDNISVLNQKSHFFKEVADLEKSTPITTYKAKNYGDVPYLSCNDLSLVISTMSSVNFNYKKEGSVATLTKTDNPNCFVKFDAKNNEISDLIELEMSTSLVKLNLENNLIEDEQNISFLSSLDNLEYINLLNNPIKNYESKLKELLPNLKEIDVQKEICDEEDIYDDDINGVVVSSCREVSGQVP